VANLAVENLALKRQLMKVEERLAGYELDAELIKQKMEELKFYEEGGIFMAYADEKAKAAFVEHLRRAERT
jgi:hypothetical protein